SDASRKAEQAAGQESTATDSKLSLAAKRVERAAAAERRRRLESSSPDNNAAKIEAQGRQGGILQPEREDAGEGEEETRPFTPPLGNACRTPPLGTACRTPPLGNSCPRAGAVPLGSSCAIPPLGENSCLRAGAVEEGEEEDEEEGVVAASPGNSLGIRSVDGGELMPDSFLGWEDFFVEPGDRLEDLEALHLQKGNVDDEVGGGSSSGSGSGSGCGSGAGIGSGIGSRGKSEDNSSSGQLSDGEVRRRACSDSVFSSASSSSSSNGVPMECTTSSAWLLSLDGGIEMIGEEEGSSSSGSRWLGSSTAGRDEGFRLQGGGLPERGGGDGVWRPWEKTEDHGERSCLGVSDSA
ncbi:unnamed protein product, partial [Laminaria digitata]